MLIQRFLLLSLLILCGAEQGLAQPPTDYLTVQSIALKPDSIPAGGKTTLQVTVQVANGYHINANRPDDPNLIPTVLKLMAPGKTTGVAFGKPVYPKPKTITVGYSEKPMRVYEGTILISVPVMTKATGKPQKVSLSGTLRAQGCNATACFPPVQFPVAATLTVTSGKKP